MDLTIISPNMMKLFGDCPNKFYYKYVEQISAPGLDKNFNIGKNIHALASYYLKKQDIHKFEEVLTQKEKEIWDYLKNNKFFNYKVVSVEKNLAIKLDKYWIGGRLDAVVKQNKNYYILDYKTGTLKDDMTYDVQTMTYMCALAEGLEDYDSLSFIYLDLKNKKDIKIDFSDKLKKDYIEKLTNICSEIVKTTKHSTKACTRQACEYKKICQSSH